MLMLWWLFWNIYYSYNSWSILETCNTESFLDKKYYFCASFKIIFCIFCYDVFFGFLHRKMWNHIMFVLVLQNKSHHLNLLCQCLETYIPLALTSKWLCVGFSVSPGDWTGRQEPRINPLSCFSALLSCLQRSM